MRHRKPFENPAQESAGNTRFFREFTWGNGSNFSVNWGRIIVNVRERLLTPRLHFALALTKLNYPSFLAPIKQLYMDIKNIPAFYFTEGKVFCMQTFHIPHPKYPHPNYSIYQTSHIPKILNIPHPEHSSPKPLCKKQ